MTQLLGPELTLSGVVHGYSGVGKSWLLDTVPAPRLILDAEGRSKFTPSRPKVVWDPAREEPPRYDGSWQTCVTFVRSFDTLQRVFAWLNAGQHDFASVGFDSLTEIQKRCMDQVVGTGAPQTQDWGSLLRYMEGLVRQFRDLTFHPIKSISTVVFTALTSEKDGRITPHVQGALRDTLPGYVDFVGYLYAQAAEDGLSLQRKLLIQPWGNILAKDNTDYLTKKYGMAIASPNLTEMLEVIKEAA